MAYSRGFSDAEIVTIATVAATAIGGIVLGLARGQANEATRLAGGREHLLERASAGVGHVRQALPGSEQLESLASQASAQAHNLPDRGEAIITSARDLVSAAMQRPEIRSEILAAAQQLKALGGEFDSRSGTVTGAIRSGQGRFLPKVDVEDLLARVKVPDPLNLLRRGNRSAISDAKSSLRKFAGTVSGLRQRPSIPNWRGGQRSELVAAPPDFAEWAGATYQERVATPLAQVATSTRDSLKQALAATIWLVIGAGIVYFALLSVDRREKVKDALCGALEQGRLLLLDLQGYEPDM